MDTIIVRGNKPLILIAVLMFAAAFIFLPIIIYSDLNGNETVLFGYIMAAGFFAGGLLLLLYYKLRRFTIDKKECCYRPMFGRTRRFELRDIKLVKVTVKSDTVIRLYNMDGQCLARLEGSMRGSAELLKFFEMRGIPITLQDVSIREGKVTVKQDQGEVTERIWAKHPRFYQSPLWIRRVRLMLKLMNIAGVVLAVAAWQLFDIRQEGLVYIFCPLAFYITYLLFYRIIVFEVPKTATKHWKETHINFPFAALTCVTLFAIYDARGINLRGGRAYLFIPAAALILMIPVLLIARPARSRKTVLGICLLLLMYGYISMPYVNWVFCTGQPEYEPGVVVDKAH